MKSSPLNARFKQLEKLIVLMLILGSFVKNAYAQGGIPSAGPGVQYGKTLHVSHAVAVDGLEQILTADSVYTGQIKGEVIEVCKKKGCFVKVARKDGGDPVLVRFKDYGFFMPQDIVGKTIVMEGVAKVKETSVDRLKHWAEDAGKTQDEIAQITKPKTDIEIIAEGVVVVK